MITKPDFTQDLKNLLESVDKPAMVMFKGIIEYFNQDTLSFLELSKQSLQDKKFTEIFKNNSLEDISETLYNTMINDQLITESSKVKLEYISSKEKINHCLCNFKVFKVNEESLLLASFSPFSEVSALQSENAELKRQNLLKTSFLANMSHEIRTPLNSIIGFSELLLEEDNTQDEEELYKKLISSSGKSLLQLIEDIIDFSKIESGQLSISKSSFDLNEFLDELYVSFEQEKQSRGLNHLEIKLSKGSENEYSIYTDETRLRQVLSNLITNALKFTDEGFIEFGYRFTNDQLQFYTRDTGTGIKEDARSGIFERFCQDKSTIKRNAEGSGLGLAISKSIINLLHGEIWLDTQTGYGTTVYFTIPVEKNEAKAKPHRSKNEEFVMPDYSGHKVLIVDDVEQNIYFYESVFKPTKAYTIIARSGLEAVEKCKTEENIEIILMDIMMPESDGYEATRSIKADFPNIPIIMQTAFNSPETKKNSQEAGADEFISKPIDLIKIFGLINKYLKK